ncbi:MAG: adenosylcobinamide amidohydrolase [Hydrogeniiclostridium mannosilyticum]
MILLFSCKLSPGILTRALVTATEAKAAAVGELMVPSRYSHGIATGSGTDGVILSADLSANIELTDAEPMQNLGS